MTKSLKLMIVSLTAATAVLAACSKSGGGSTASTPAPANADGWSCSAWDCANGAAGAMETYTWRGEIDISDANTFRNFADGRLCDDNSNGHISCDQLPDKLFLEIDMNAQQLPGVSGVNFKALFRNGGNHSYITSYPAQQLKRMLAYFSNGQNGLRLVSSSVSNPQLVILTRFANNGRQDMDVKVFYKGNLIGTGSATDVRSANGEWYGGDDDGYNIVFGPAFYNNGGNNGRFYNFDFQNQFQWERNHHVHCGGNGNGLSFQLGFSSGNMSFGIGSNNQQYCY